MQKTLRSKLEARAWGSTPCSRGVVRGRHRHSRLPTSHSNCQGAQGNTLSRYSRVILTDSLDDARAECDNPLFECMAEATNALLNFITLFFPSISDCAQQSFLLSQLQKLCERIRRLPSLALFRTMFPPPYELIKRVRLNSPQASAHNDRAGDAISDQKAGYWMCPHAGDHEWSAFFESGEAQDISVIRVNWCPSADKMGNIFAPSHVLIYTINVVGNRDSNTLVKSIRMKDEKARHLTWEHSYEIDVKNVFGIKLVFLDGFLVEPSGQDRNFRLYGVEVFSGNNDISTAPPLRVLHEIKSELISLSDCRHDESIRSLAISSLFDLAKCSGSLLFLLKCIVCFREKIIVERAVDLQPLADALAAEVSKLQLESEGRNLQYQKWESLYDPSSDVWSPYISMLRNLCDLVCVRSAILRGEIEDSTPTTPNLEFPFCVEVTTEVLQLLCQTMSTFCSLDEENNLFMMTIMMVLHLQLIALKRSKLAPSSAGLSQEILGDIRHVSWGLMDHTDDNICSLATTVFCEIVACDANSASELCEFALSSLKYTCDLSITSVSTKDCCYRRFLAHLKLAEFMIRRLSMIEYVSEGLELAVLSGSWRNRFLEMASIMITIIGDVGVDAWEESELSSQNDPIEAVRKQLANTILSYLELFQDRLVHRMLNKCDLVEGTKVSVVLREYSTMIISKGVDIFTMFIYIRKSGKSVEFHPTDKFISILLLPLLESICSGAIMITIAEVVLPKVSELLVSISDAVQFSKVCLRGQELVYLASRFSASGVKKWQTIDNVCFESQQSLKCDYELFVNNLVFVSKDVPGAIASLNISFSDHQVAAWEFQKEGNFESGYLGALPLRFDYILSTAYAINCNFGEDQLPHLVADISRWSLKSNDVIRFVYDGPTMTLSCSINGEDPKIIFRNVMGPITPFCGSNVRGSRFRLLKVEEYQTISPLHEKICFCDSSSNSPLIDPCVKNQIECSVFKQIPMCLNDHRRGLYNVYRTARGSIGASDTSHDWCFEVLSLDLHHADFNEKMRFGVVRGERLHRVELGVTDQAPELAWCCDGSLWAEGKMCPELFGGGIKIKRYDIIRMVIDPIDGTLNYYINDEFIGLAFGPAGSGAVMETKILVSVGSECVYPAVSLFGSGQSVQIKAGGYNNSPYNVPLITACQKYCAASLVYLSSMAISGHAEQEIGVWLKSPLFFGGVVQSNFAMLGLNSKEDYNLTVPAGTLVLNINDIRGIYPFNEKLGSNVFVKADLRVKGSVVASTISRAPVEKGAIAWLSCEELKLTVDACNSVSLSKPAMLSILIYTEQLQSNDLTICEIGSVVADISAELSPRTANGQLSLFLNPFGELLGNIRFVPFEHGVSPFVACLKKSNSPASFYKSDPQGDFIQQLVNLDSVVGLYLFEWLERIRPDPPLMKRAMINANQYHFPSVERPLVACLLKHGALLNEACAIYSEIKQHMNSTGAPNLVSDILTLPEPSPEMVLMWMNIKQVRSYLRQLRQRLKSHAPLPKEGVNETSVRESSDSAHDDILPVEEIPFNAASLQYQKSSVKWKRQPRSSDHVGIDLVAKILYVLISVTHIKSDDDKEYQTNGWKLCVGNQELDAIRCQCSFEYRDNIVVMHGVLRFDISEEDLSKISNYTLWKLIRKADCLDSDYSSMLYLPSLRDHASCVTGVEELFESELQQINQTDATTKDMFGMVCAHIINKTMLLLSLSPARVEGAETVVTASTFLRTLVNRSSSSIPRHVPKRRNNEKQSDIMLFMHRHNQLKKMASAKNIDFSMVENENIKHGYDDVESLLHRGDSDNNSIGVSEASGDLDTESLSPAEIMWHACIAFITENIDSTEKEKNNSIDQQELLRLLEVRYSDMLQAIAARRRRALLRIIGIEAISVALKVSSICSDPLLVEELTSRIRSSFISGSGSNVIVNLQGIEQLRPRFHYLSDLECCDSELLSSVQASFMTMYTLLAELLQEYMYRWQTCAAEDRCQQFSLGDLMAAPPQLKRRWSNESMSQCTLSQGTALPIERFLRGGNMGDTYIAPIWTLLQAWDLDFSGRDYLFLIRTNISSLLQNMFSLEDYETIASGLLLHGQKVVNFTCDHMDKFGKEISLRHSLKNANDATVRNDLMELIIKYSGLHSEEAKKHLACLRMSYRLYCRRMSLSDVSFEKQYLNSLSAEHSQISNGEGKEAQPLNKETDVEPFGQHTDSVSQPVKVKENIESNIAILAQFGNLLKVYRVKKSNLTEFDNLREYGQDLLLLIALSISTSVFSSGLHQTDINDHSEHSNSDSMLCDLDVLPTKPVLNKERSVFGTPKDATVEPGKLLSAHIIAGLVQDVIIGSIYCSRSVGTDCNWKCNILNCTIPEGSSLSSIATDLQNGVIPLDVYESDESTLSAAGAVELSEIEDILFRRLASLRMLCSACSEVSVELSRSFVLKAILRLLKIGTPRLRTEISQILQCCITHTTPISIGNALPEFWLKMTGFEWDCVRSMDAHNSRQEKVDCFVFGLLDDLASVVTNFPPMSLSDCENMEAPPFGLGHNYLMYGQQLVLVLQALLLAPKWSDTILEYFINVLKKVTAVLNAECKTAERTYWLRISSAVCAAISGFDVPCSGTRGFLDDGTEVMITSHAAEGDMIEVMKIYDNKILASKIETVTVKPSSFTIRNTAVLEYVSGALIQYAAPLLNKCLVSEQKFHDEMLYYRFSSLLWQTFCTMLDEKSAEILNSVIVNESVVNAVLLNSLHARALGIPHSVSELKNQRIFIQARIHEKCPHLGVIATKTESQPEVIVSDDGDLRGDLDGVDVNDPSTIGNLAADCESSYSDYRCKFIPNASNSNELDSLLSEDELLRIATSWIELHQIKNVNFSLTLLDYFMHDARAAEEYIYFNKKTIHELENAFGEQSQMDENGYVGSTCSKKAFLRHLSQHIESPIIFCAENVKPVDRVQSVIGASSERIEPGDFVRLKGVDSLSSIRRVTSLPVSAREKSVGLDFVSAPQLVVSKYHFQLGVFSYENYVPSATEKIINFFGHDFEDLPTLTIQIDNCLSIAYAREIFSKLFHHSIHAASASTASLAFLSNKPQILKLLKLLCVFEPSRKCIALNNCLSSISFLSGDRFSGKNLISIEAIIEDLENQFIQLLNPLNFEQERSDDSISKFSSVRPLIAGYDVEGVIQVPNAWLGAVITFDCRFTIPAQVAELTFKFDLNQQKTKIVSYPRDPFDGDDPSFVVPGGKSVSMVLSNKQKGDGDVHILSVCGGFKTKFGEAGSFIATKDFAVTSGLNSSAELGFDSFRLRNHCLVLVGATNSDDGLQSDSAWFFETRVGSGQDITDLHDYGMVGVTQIPVQTLQQLRQFKLLQPRMCRGCFLMSDGNVRVVYSGEESSVLSEINYRDLPVPDFVSWKNGDVIGCLVQTMDIGDHSVCRIRFAINGYWLGMVIKIALLTSCCLFPAFNVKSGMTVVPNLGTLPFIYPPVLQMRNNPTVTLDIFGCPVIDESMASDFCEDKIVSILPVDPVQSFRHNGSKNPPMIWWHPPSIRSPLAMSNIGYKFEVEELRRIPTRIGRRFNLVMMIDKSADGVGPFWIWEPVEMPPDFMATSLSITLTNKPPHGVIIMHRSFGEAPVTFEKIHSGSKFSIWRPHPPPNYVSLSDLVCNSADPILPSLSSWLCVPISAVRAAACERSFRFRNGINLIITDKGSFQFNKGSLAALPYSINSYPGCYINGSWECDQDILIGNASFVWAVGVLEHVLSNPNYASAVASSSLVQVLIKYLYAEDCIGRFDIIPILTKIIRVFRDQGVSLKVDLLKEVAEAILAEIVAISSIESFEETDQNSVYALVNFVVEFAAYMMFISRESRCLPLSVENDTIANPTTDHGKFYIIHKHVSEDYIQKNREVDEKFSMEVDNLQCQTRNGNFYDARGRFSFPDTHEWWKTSISEEEKSKYRLRKTLSNAVQGDDSNEIFASFQNVLNFLDAFGNGFETTQRFIYSFPHDALMDAWNEHVRNCSLEETKHPYLPISGKYRNRVHFPGAKQLILTFDSRCSLGNSTLTLRFFQAGKSQRITLFGTDIDGNWPAGPVIIDSDIVFIDFSSSAPSSSNSCTEEHKAPVSEGEIGLFDLNSDGNWGWSILVSAVGRTYRNFITHVKVPRHIVSHSVFGNVSSVDSSPNMKGNCGVSSSGSSPAPILVGFGSSPLEAPEPTPHFSESVAPADTSLNSMRRARLRARRSGGSATSRTNITAATSSNTLRPAAFHFTPGNTIGTTESRAIGHAGSHTVESATTQDQLFSIPPNNVSSANLISTPPSTKVFFGNTGSAFSITKEVNRGTKQVTSK